MITNTLLKLMHEYNWSFFRDFLCDVYEFNIQRILYVYYMKGPSLNGELRKCKFQDIQH